MRVLIADKFEQSGLEGLKNIKCEVDFQPDLKDDALVRAVKDTNADVLVVRSTKVTESALAAGNLKLVVRAGAGYNTIDVAAASARGIYVSNCPGKNAVAVAELAFALMLALDRRIADNVITLRQGQWNKKEFSKARGLYGRTLGIIGVGGIGREVITRAHSFGMAVVAWSRSLTKEEATRLGVSQMRSINEVAEISDIVSIHLALKDDTRGLIGKDFIDSMREGAFFINTSRGEVVDQNALIEAMHSRHIRAGLDVFANEPTTAQADFTDAIKDEPNLYGTHHIGASTDQAQEAIAAETVRIIREFMQTGEVPNVVNLATQSPATHALTVRHRDQPGVLASVLEGLKNENINVQEMENIIFAGAEAAVARINLDRAPSGDTLKKLKDANSDIIEINLLALK